MDEIQERNERRKASKEMAMACTSYIDGNADAAAAVWVDTVTKNILYINVDSKHRLRYIRSRGKMAIYKNRYAK